MLNSLTLPSIDSFPNRGGSFGLVQRRFLPSGRILALLGVLVLSYVAVLVLQFWAQAPAGLSDERESLVSNLDWLPNCPGRLIGGFRPKSAQGHIEKQESRRLLLSLQRSLATKLKGPRTVELLADMAVVKLAMGQVAQSVSLLEQAVDRMPQDSQLLNDLSAAYLARFKSQGDPQDLVLALAMADRAIAAEPDLAEAYFNRALSLELLFLTSEADSAWDAYQDLDPDSPWTREAARYIGRRTLLSEEQEWDKKRAALLNFSEQDISVLVRRFPQAARLFAEERILTEWGIAWGSGDQERARDLLRVARVMAESLVRMSGDRLLQESVAIVDEALSSPARLAILAAGHAQYRNALDLLEDRQYADAAVQFASARRDLVRGGSPYAIWPLTQIAFCQYQQSTYELAFSSLDKVLSEVANRGFLTVEARALWIRGTILVFVARSTESLAAYRKACDLYLRARETGHAAALHTRLARNLESLGDSAGAWRHRYEALQDMLRSSDPERRRVMMGEAAWGVIDMGYPGVARYFQKEAVRAAEEQADPGALAVAHRQLAEILHLDGDLDGSVRELAVARQHAQEVSDPGLSTTVETEIAVVEGRVKYERDPDGALTAIRSALHANLTLGDRFFLPDLYLQRARIYRSLGKIQMAEADLNLAIQEWEVQRSLVEEYNYRLLFFERGRIIYDEMADLQFIELRQPEKALLYAEMTKGRILSDLLGYSNDEPVSSILGRAAQSLTMLRNMLPKNTVILYYTVLPDRTLLWLITRNRVQTTSLGISATKLSAVVANLRAKGEAGADEMWMKHSAVLFNAILQPVASSIPRNAQLLIIPDRSLFGVPFNALFDRSNQRFAMEQWSISSAPSLKMLHLSTSRTVSATSRAVSVSSRALVVANPKFRRSLFPSLADLRHAGLEGEWVAGRFPGSLLLLRERATSERFLAEADKFDIIHFAGHSLTYPRQPFLSSLVFSPTAGEYESGVLTASDLLGRRFDRVRLVVLSSCRSVGGGGADPEGLLGLATPFLAGGAHVVVASLWPVKDREAEAFFEVFYGQLDLGATPHDALREAALRSRHGQRGPITLGAWASFTAIGIPVQITR